MTTWNKFFTEELTAKDNHKENQVNDDEKYYQNVERLK